MKALSFYFFLSFFSSLSNLYCSSTTAEKRRRLRVLTGGGEKRKIEMTFVYGFVYGANRLIYLDRSLQRNVCGRPALCRYGPAAAGYKTC